MCRPGVERFCAQEQSQITPIIRSIPVQYETRTNETGRERELSEVGGGGGGWLCWTKVEGRRFCVSFKAIKFVTLWLFVNLFSFPYYFYLINGKTGILNQCTNKCIFTGSIKQADLVCRIWSVLCPQKSLDRYTGKSKIKKKKLVIGSMNEILHKTS